jgi:hypothetical protein
MTKSSPALTIRITEEEQQQMASAAAQDAQPGDRGGLSAWARRTLLREAQRVLGTSLKFEEK